MGAGQSTEKKSPTKEVKQEQESPKKPTVASPSKPAAKEEQAKTPVKGPAGDQAEAEVNLQVSEEEVASIEAAAKKMRDTVGGTSIEIVLSPAVKKPKSRVSPPTSPSSSDEVAIARKLAEAQERKQSLEQEKAKRLADHLEKISLAKEKKEKEHEKFSAKVLEKIESKQGQAEELKKKQMDEVKEKEMLTALKDHSVRIKNVRTNMEDQMKPKAQSIIENIAKKEEASRELKAKQEAERKLKVEEMEKRRELVRQNKEKLASEQSLTSEVA